jgi:O-antigen/teichoic acid export membrane protein
MTEAADAQATGRRLAGRTAGLLAVRVTGLVMGLAVAIVLARGLGARALGTFATALALLQIGSALTDFGVNALLIREGVGAPTLRAAMLRWAMCVRVVAGVVMFVALSCAAVLLVDDTASRISVVLVLSAIPLSALTLGMTVFQQQLMLGRMALLLLAQSVMWLAMVAMLFALDAGLRAYAVAFVGYNVAYGVLVHRAARRALVGPADPMAFRQFMIQMRGVVPLSLTFVLVVLYYKFDSVFVYRFAGEAAAGSYSVAFRFLEQLAIIPITLGNLFLPLLSRRHRSGLPTQPMFDRYVRITLLLSAPVVALGMVLAEPLVMLFGPSYADAVPLLRLLLPAFLISAFGYVPVHVAIVHGLSRKQLLAATIGLVMNVGLNFVLFPYFGVPGVAVVTVVTELGVVGTLYLVLRRPCAISLPWRWSSRLAAVLLLCAAAALPLRGNPYLAAAAVVVVYCAGVVALSVIDLAEIRGLLRRSSPPEVPLPRDADADVAVALAEAATPAALSQPDR